MKQVISVLAVVVIAVAGGSYFTYKPESAGTSDEGRQFSLEKPEGIDSSTWKPVLMQIGDYFDNSKAIAEAKAAAEREKNSRKEQELTDATLIGIVQLSAPKAILLIPGKDEPITLATGQSWLAPWELDAIGADSVRWKNSETQVTQTQYLFN